MESDARITELEAMLGLLDDQVDQLNQVVFRQQEQIDSLQGQLRLVWQRMNSQGAVESLDPRDEIPPHY